MYVSSEKLIASIEGILDYYTFTTIETNTNYRVSQGYFRGHAAELADKLNTELESIEFDIDDSVFIVYPVMDKNGQPSLSTIVLKRKGNRYLRRKAIR
jgi:hypothetical protein